MNNYNFADWDLNKLLPKEDNLNFLRNCFIWVTDIAEWSKYEPIIVHFKNRSEKDIVHGMAYTWEDIRLYLESKGYLLKLTPYVDVIDNTDDFQILYYYDIIVVSTGEVETDFTYYHTYEEARREAIIYCLNQINNG